MNKTLLDLYKSANEAAHSALDHTTTHAVDSAALNAFNAEGHDPRDWQHWINYFKTARDLFQSLRGQAAPSTLGPASPKITK